MKPLRVIITGLLLFISGSILASHLRSVEIRATRTNCNSLTYEITLIAYVNYTAVLFGGEDASLSFGDGQKMFLEETQAVIIDPVLKIGIVTYTVSHTYNGVGRYIISYQENNRNDGILNIEASATSTFYTEVEILVEAGTCSSSPQLMIPPLDRACSGITFYHSTGAIDNDGDSLSYELVTPQRALNTTVTNYKLPNDKVFYDLVGIDFNKANEEKNGTPDISIDPATGLIVWDAPGATGEYTLAIKVTEWKFNATDSLWYNSGYVIRDMQIIVENCSNRKPALSLTPDVCVVAGERVEFTLTGTDPDQDSVSIEVFTDITNASTSPVSGTIQATSATNPAIIKFAWTTTCQHVRYQSYRVVFKITDKPASGPKLAQFKTVHIKVLAPPPLYDNVTVNPITKQVTLQWQNACDNFTATQVWRRVAKFHYAQPSCANGMPYSLRYELLAEVPATSKNYIDAEIAVGAQYCYRMVALIGPNKVPSKISLDTCIIPKPAEAPVITKVSVVETDSVKGKIIIQWTPPFNLDQTQYPPPYQYKIYRALGMHKGEYNLVTSLPLDKNIFIDSLLNTQSFSYQYKIELYTPALTSAPIDTSTQASSVQLITTPLAKAIKLSWSMNTPWYNFSQNFPYHLIYRSDNINKEFILLDSVDVNEYGFTFTDDNNLRNNLKYFYKILTRGTYGNPSINEPIENYSQIAGNFPLDTIAPCSPALTLEPTDCRSIPCEGKNYYNTLNWNSPDANCTDIINYKVYVAKNDTEAFQYLATTNKNYFTHSLLDAPAKCYRITAVDIAGNESTFSNVTCVDNCAYFELPNVITPYNNDGVNDSFGAFTSDSEGKHKCARFVKAVDLKIYDRWGKEIYNLKTETPENNYTFWDGRYNSGKEVSAGIYYYSAKVEFYMLDPNKQHQLFKGWLQVVH